MANGYGTYTKANGLEKYEGQWMNDQQHGQGKETFADGSIYEGHFIGGARNGEGVIHYTDGAVYRGQFVDNYCHGKKV